LNPEPPRGPLPDFIVDPEENPPENAEPSTPEVMPKLRLSAPEPPAAEPVSDAPSIENLALPPLTEYPSLPSLDLGAASQADPADDETDADAEEPTERKARRGRRQAPEPSKRGKRDRSSGEPGDDETMDWAGLSSRLSAYSLSSENLAPEATEPGDRDASADAEPDADGPSEPDTEDGT
jgi:hypothetical protein